MDSKQLLKIYNGLNSINLSLSLMGTTTTMHDGSWEHFNSLIEQAAQLTSDQHFLTSKIQASSGHRGQPFVRVNDYASKVFAATSYLYDQYHEDYFDDDVRPPTLGGKISGSSSPAHVINNTQHQESSQSQNTEINIEFNQTFQYVTEQLIHAEEKFEDGSPEKGFIQKMKSVLSTARSTADIIKLIAVTAAETGLAAEALKKIFL